MLGLRSWKKYLFCFWKSHDYFVLPIFFSLLCYVFPFLAVFWQVLGKENELYKAYPSLSTLAFFPSPMTNSSSSHQFTSPSFLRWTVSSLILLTTPYKQTAIFKAGFWQTYIHTPPQQQICPSSPLLSTPPLQHSHSKSDFPLFLPYI